MLKKLLYTVFLLVPISDYVSGRAFQQIRPIIPSGSSTLLRVVQLNTLADGLFGLRADHGMHSRFNSSSGDWNYRKFLLLDEITSIEADVVCLQEVDHYYDFFLPEMRRLGYAGLYAPKPISSCLEVSSSCDGCAIFVKEGKLRIISSETVTLSLSKAEMKDGGEISEDLIRAQNQVALVCICELQNNKGASLTPPIIVATTHLKSSRSATGERYRLKEILQVLAVIENVQSILSSSKRPAAVLLAGDFNAVPESQSFEPLTYRAIKNHQSLALRSVYNEDFPYQSRFMNEGEFSPSTFLSYLDRGNGEEIVKRCIGTSARNLNIFHYNFKLYCRLYLLHSIQADSTTYRAICCASQAWDSI